MKPFRTFLAFAIVTFLPASIAFSQPISTDWETVRTFSHLGSADGLTDKEIEMLATRNDLITLEKRHGIDLHGSTEAGTLADARRIRAINPDAKVIFYWNLFLDYPAYEASKSRVDTPDWFLKNADGSLSLKGPSGLKRYDISHPGFQDWWVDTAAEIVRDKDIAGVFIDALPQIAGRPSQAEASWGKEKAQELDEAINVIISKLRNAIGPDKLILYNGIRSVEEGWDHGGLKYIADADGIMIEHFSKFASSEVELIEQDIELMMAASDAQKMVFLKGFPDFTWLDSELMKQDEAALYDRAKHKIDFPLASFLIVAGPQSYFNFSWGYRAKHGNLLWYDAFDNRLGRPLSRAQKSGFMYTRKFEHANVKLDIEAKTGEIKWKRPNNHESKP